MEHLSFDIICRIADGDVQTDELGLYSTHLKSCITCRQEVELQKSIVKVSQQARLINPSAHFTQDVLDVVIPSKKKKWYERILNNMGNAIAMALALGFLGYIFSITDTYKVKSDSPSKIEPVFEFVTNISAGTQQFGKYLISNISTKNLEAPHTHILIFVLLAIMVLVFIDRIAEYFFRRIKAHL